MIYSRIIETSLGFENQMIGSGSGAFFQPQKSLPIFYLVIQGQATL
jgi:hypothetical protein